MKLTSIALSTDDEGIKPRVQSGQQVDRSSDLRL